MERDRALAGFALGGLLFAAALPGTPSGPKSCLTPVEVAASAGRTDEVRCDAAPARPAEIRGPARLLFGMPIDLNCADAPTLQVLVGIGTVRAQAILDARRVRPFSDVDDLTRVPGIGPRTLERLRPEIAVASEAADSASVDFQGCRSDGESSWRPASGGRG